MKYFGAITLDIINHDVFTLNVNRQHLGYGPNLNMSGPPKGSIPAGAIVEGFKGWQRENYVQINILVIALEIVSNFAYLRANIKHLPPECYNSRKVKNSTKPYLKENNIEK